MRNTGIWIAMLCAAGAFAAAGSLAETQVFVRAVAAAGDVRVSVEDDDGVLAAVTAHTAADSACGGCPAASLRALAALRDLVARDPRARAAAAHAALRQMLGRFADLPADRVPETGLAGADTEICTKTVRYRYTTCSGECGTVDGEQITCTCEVSGPIKCPWWQPPLEPERS